MSEAMTPVADLLDEVPEDTVLGIQGNEPVFRSYHNIPIGRLAKEAAAEIRRLQHNNEVLTNALWKACGDDEQVANDTIESQGALR
jgi:hypothetical protein